MPAAYPVLPQAALDHAIRPSSAAITRSAARAARAGFPELPQAALDHAIATISPTFLGSNHEVGGEGGAGGSLEVPQVALDNAIDHLPTFLGGNHEVGGEG